MEAARKFLSEPGKESWNLSIIQQYLASFCLQMFRVEIPHGLNDQWSFISHC